MTLRKSLIAFAFTLFAFQAFSHDLAVKNPLSTTPNAEQMEKIQAMVSTLQTKDLSKLTIREVEELTGQEMSFKEKVAFKVAKMKMKKMEKKAVASMKAGNDFTAPGIDKGIYILLAIIGFPFLSVGLASNWEGNDWLYCLLLTFLCWLPGFIYALIKMKNYYNS